MKNLKIDKLLKFQSKTFVNKLYVNSTHKIFKFTSNPKEKEILSNQKELKETYERLERLKEDIKEKDRQIYADEPLEQKTKIKLLKKDEESRSKRPRKEQTQSMKEKNKLINSLNKLEDKIEILKKKLNIKEKRPTISNELAYKKEHKFSIGNVIDSHSWRLNFQSEFFSYNMYKERCEDESVDFNDIEEQEKLRRQEKLIYEEIDDGLDYVADWYFKNEDLIIMEEQQVIPSTEILRSKLANENHPSFLLYESDLHCQYDLPLTYEKAVKASLIDEDFGNELDEKKEQSNNEDTWENIKDDDSEVLNSCVQKFPFIRDSEIDNLAKSLL